MSRRERFSARLLFSNVKHSVQCILCVLLQQVWVAFPPSTTQFNSAWPFLCCGRSEHQQKLGRSKQAHHQWWANRRSNLIVISQIIQYMDFNHLAQISNPIFFLKSQSSSDISEIFNNFRFKLDTSVYWFCTASKTTWYRYSGSVITVSYCNAVSQLLRIELHEKQ